MDDGSSDQTSEAARAAGARVVRHPYNKGNGAAVKTGIREAQGELVLLMDGDGQHDPADIQKIIALLPEYDLVVGARAWNAQATFSRGLGNLLLARLASYLCGRKIPDLTSGFRAARRDRMREFLHLFPNGFSYPTTSTMAFVRAGYNLRFVPIDGKQRTVSSTSKMRPWREGVRFLVIILRMVTLFSPLRDLPADRGFLFRARLRLHGLYHRHRSARDQHLGALAYRVRRLVSIRFALRADRLPATATATGVTPAGRQGWPPK